MRRVVTSLPRATEQRLEALRRVLPRVRGRLISRPALMRRLAEIGLGTEEQRAAAGAVSPAELAKGGRCPMGLVAPFTAKVEVPG